jgi:hypothetical protein
MSMNEIYNALIRTHHITSRKKIAALRKAADTHHCYVLLRTGGSPGVMYVEGKQEEDVSSWVAIVQKLRYKDYQLVSRPKCMKLAASDPSEMTMMPRYMEVNTIKEFGSIMQERGLLDWWRTGMGYLSR